MSSSARLNTAVEGLNVTVLVHGRQVRAVVTREALEMNWKVAESGPQAMLASFHQHQLAIETAIIDRYKQDLKEPVVLFCPVE